MIRFWWTTENLISWWGFHDRHNKRRANEVFQVKSRQPGRREGAGYAFPPTHRTKRCNVGRKMSPRHVLA